MNALLLQSSSQDVCFLSVKFNRQQKCQLSKSDKVALIDITDFKKN